MNFSKGSTERFYGIHVIAKWLFMIYVLKYMYMRDGLYVQYHNDSTSYAADTSLTQNTVL